MHHIQHDILSKLSLREWARFRDMIPEGIETNHYTYHLNSLKNQGYIEKQDKSYRLSPKGLAYADRMSKSKVAIRLQPKIITMMVLVNEQNAVFMTPKTKQPFIGRWNLPNGKIHLSDTSVKAAALRECREKLGLELEDAEHVGDAYIRVSIHGELVSSVLAHVFLARVDSSSVTSKGLWTTSQMRKETKLAPAVYDIIDSALSARTRFFEEYDVDW